MHTYTVRQLLELYGHPTARNSLIYAEESGAIPKAGRRKRGSLEERVWTSSDLAAIGRRYGFLASLAEPRCVAVYSSKGGVLKTTLAFNLGRIAAINGHRTCVVGLDYQSDITNLLGGSRDDEASSIEDVIEMTRTSRGLREIFNDNCSIDAAICQTDIETLSFIPENGNLLLLERALYAEVARERMLLTVVQELKKHYDLIVLDCNPSWTVLTDNALVACDVLISPVECKIGQFRNLDAFQHAIDDFGRKIDKSWVHLHVPTRFIATKKISCDIYAWYRTHLKGTTAVAIKESSMGEEACGENLSLLEYKPSSQYADDMKSLIVELWQMIGQAKAREAA